MLRTAALGVELDCFPDLFQFPLFLYLEPHLIFYETIEDRL